MNKQVIVTGAGGYIGSVLIGHLLEAGYAVKAIDRFFFGTDILLGYRGQPNLQVCIQDIRSLTAADLEGSWGVIDLAALSNDPSGDLDPQLTLEINQSGRTNVATAAKSAGVVRYVFSSSCSVYGAGDQDDLTESSPLNPLTAYAKSCAIAEEHVRGLNGPNFTAGALRLATVFGLSARMRFDLVVNLMTLDAFKQRVVTVMGGQQWRPLIGVHDVARGFVAALASPAHVIGGNAFNIGLTNMRVLDIASIVRKAVPVEIEVVTKPNPLDRRDYNVSFARANALLGFTARQEVGDSVREIFRALQAGHVYADERTRTVAWYSHLLKQGTLTSNLMQQAQDVAGFQPVGVMAAPLAKMS